MGNLTKDPELRSTPSGQKVGSFSLALNRSYKVDDQWQEATDFVDVVMWGTLAERVKQYVFKGRPVLVSGRIQSRSWEQDGQKRSKVEVVANDVICNKEAFAFRPITETEVLQFIEDQADNEDLMQRINWHSYTKTSAYKEKISE